MTERIRLDTLLVARGLTQTRVRARALVLAGQVRVDGNVFSKPGMTVSTNSTVTLITPDHPYVSRGGIKLAHALDKFRVSAIGCTAMDIGASTGGFTDVLLKRGATRVVAIDVGHGQLAWKLRQDPRVFVLEGINARGLNPTMLPSGFQHVDLVTIDVSFISLKLILKPTPALLRQGASVIALIKPQFEAGREEVGKRGLITDEAVHQRVVEEVTIAADRVGLSRVDVTPSPITGTTGNQEFFVHLRVRNGMSSQ